MSEEDKAAAPPVASAPIRMLGRGTIGGTPVPQRTTDMPLPPAEPTEMVVREIDFEIDGKQLIFRTINAWKLFNVNRQIFDTVIKQVAAGDVSALTSVGTHSVDPCPSSLSISSKVPRYLVFMLSSTKNWQFAQTGPAITVTQGTAAVNYFEGFRVDPNGVPTLNGPGGSGLDYCRVAYLVNVRTGGLRFSHPFNLNVDLFNDREDQITPIMIDPDIRYPGGDTLNGE
ncbi:MAG: nucleotide synthetase [Pseudomonadota bacterium]